MHFSAFDERFEHTRDVRRRLITLVDDQHVSVLDRLDQRRVFVHQHSINHRRLKRQCLHGRVAKRNTFQLKAKSLISKVTETYNRKYIVKN
jgi:hypothetical protein